MDREKIQTTLNQIRPALQADGGDVEIVEINPEGIIKVKLTGMCGGCPMSQMTLKQGIERLLKQAHPEIKSVQSV